MNFIKRLQKENKELAEAKEQTKKRIFEMYETLLSKKFNCGDSLDGYISTKDVMNFLDNLRQDL